MRTIRSVYLAKNFAASSIGSTGITSSSPPSLKYLSSFCPISMNIATSGGKATLVSSFPGSFAFSHRAFLWIGFRRYRRYQTSCVHFINFFSLIGAEENVLTGKICPVVSPSWTFKFTSGCIAAIFIFLDTFDEVVK